MRRIVIFGAGQIAEVAHYYLSEVAGQEVAAFVVDGGLIKSDSLLGLPVVATEEVAARFAPGDHGCFVALGYNGLGKPRRAKLDAMVAIGYAPVSFVHERALVWSGFRPEPNVMILEHNTVQPFVRIGRNTIVWSGNHIGHHATIGEDCFISSHVVISGAVTVGANSFIGVNATVRDNVAIGAESIIGAASLVLADVPPGSVMVAEATAISRVPSSRVRNI